MYGRNIENIDDAGNAVSIGGFPIITTPNPLPGDTLEFENDNSWHYVPNTSISLVGITNIGSGPNYMPAQYFWNWTTTNR